MESLQRFEMQDASRTNASAFWWTECVTQSEREMKGRGADGLRDGRRGKGLLSCITKISSFVWGSLGIPSSKYRG